MRLVIITDSKSVDAGSKNALTVLLQGKGYNTWHWIEDLWLIDHPEIINIWTLRDEIKTILPKNALFIVMSAEGIDTAGVVSTNSFKWLQENWTRNASKTGHS